MELWKERTGVDISVSLLWKFVKPKSKFFPPLLSSPYSTLTDSNPIRNLQCKTRPNIADAEGMVGTASSDISTTAPSIVYSLLYTFIQIFRRYYVNSQLELLNRSVYLLHILIIYNFLAFFLSANVSTSYVSKCVKNIIFDCL